MTRRTGAMALLGAAFLVGALAGGVTMSRLHAGDRPTRRPGGRTTHMQRLTAELTLTQAQQDSIQAVYDRHQPLMDSVWVDVRPLFDSLRAVMRTEVRQVLTPDQQVRYNAMIERQENDFRRRERERGGRNGRN